MSNQSIERIRTKLAAEREEQFHLKLRDLLDEFEAKKNADDFFVNEILIPAAAS